MAANQRFSVDIYLLFVNTNLQDPLQCLDHKFREFKVQLINKLTLAIVDELTKDFLNFLQLIRVSDQFTRTLEQQSK
jgi:hypothetical protein